MTEPEGGNSTSGGNFFDLKYQILMEEWKLVNSSVGRLDNVVLTIRGWAIAFSTTGVGFAYATPDARVAILVIAPILVIWFIDGLFKSFQRVFIDRSREIEGYLSSESFRTDFLNRAMNGILTPDLSSRFGRGSFGSRLRAVLKHLFLRNVLAIYLPLVILLFISYAIISIWFSAPL